MTEAVDLLLTNAEVYTLAESGGSAGIDSDADEYGGDVHEAVAVRDGEIVRVGDSYDIEFLEGVETTVIDCEGRTVLPGFIDAHTHIENLGRHLVHADLSGADDPDECVERLTANATATNREWVQGFGYDESEWDGDQEYLTREDLDRVSEEHPVVAARVDMHAASLNSVALEHLADDLPESGVHRADGEPTGVVVEDAAEAVRTHIAPDYEEARELLTAGLEYAIERGVTAVHDMVRNSPAPRVYRDLEAAGELPARVRINYWADHADSVVEVGLATNSGSELVQTGAIKTFTDGSIGARTAKLSDPYHDEETDGEWVVDPDELQEIVEHADDSGLQLTVHAIGDEAVEETIAALETTADPGQSRHRIEHLELATDDQLERMAEAGVVASMQPNFHQWAGNGGLYDGRLGPDRRRRTNRFRQVLEAGVPLAFGSDCMPLDPLLGIHHAVNAPTDAQRLSVTEAVRAYTHGAAYAGFDEDRLGTLEHGTAADLVVLEESPWEHTDHVDEIDVTMTIVDGTIVFDGRA